MKIFALISTQGTAMVETALTEKEFRDPANRDRIYSNAPDDWNGGNFVDVTGNDAIVAALAPDLDQIVSRDEAVNAIMREVFSEADFTEQNDPAHDHGNEGTYGDYLADLHRRIGRILGEND